MSITQERINELAKAERRAYFKKWRADNRDKVKLHNENYWRRRIEKKLLLEAQDERTANNQ